MVPTPNLLFRRLGPSRVLLREDLSSDDDQPLLRILAKQEVDGCVCVSQGVLKSAESGLNHPS